MDPGRVKISGLLLLFAALLSLPMEGRAGTRPSYASPEALARAVVKRASGTRTVTCNVVQEKHMSMLARPVVFRGTLYLMRPDRLRLEFTTPMQSVFILDGSRILKCGGAGRSFEVDINSSPALRQAASQMLAWVNGDFTGLANMFSMSMAHAGTGVVLKPLETGLQGGVKLVTIMFHADTLRPSSVRIDEEDGDWTLLLFRDYRINSTLPENIFDECSREAAD